MFFPLPSLPTGSVLLEMQSRLQDFRHFSIGLLADLEMSEQQQNKVGSWPKRVPVSASPLARI